MLKNKNIILSLLVFSGFTISAYAANSASCYELVNPSAPGSFAIESTGNINLSFVVKNVCDTNDPLESEPLNISVSGFSYTESQEGPYYPTVSWVGSRAASESLNCNYYEPAVITGSDPQNGNYLLSITPRLQHFKILMYNCFVGLQNIINHHKL